MPHKEKQGWKETFDKQFEKYQMAMLFDKALASIIKDFIQSTHTTLLQSVVKDLFALRDGAVIHGESKMIISIKEMQQYFKNKHGLDI